MLFFIIVSYLFSFRVSSFSFSGCGVWVSCCDLLFRFCSVCLVRFVYVCLLTPFWLDPSSSVSRLSICHCADVSIFGVVDILNLWFR